MSESKPTGISGYSYVKRKIDGYWEISADDKSPDFHPTQLMGAACMYAFPPYNLAGLADLVSFLTHGSRSTHLDNNEHIFRFSFNVALPLSNHKEVIRSQWPELTQYGEDSKDEAGKNPEAWVAKVEQRFGTSIKVKPDTLGSIVLLDELAKIN